MGGHHTALSFWAGSNTPTPPGSLRGGNARHRGHTQPTYPQDALAVLKQPNCQSSVAPHLLTSVELRQAVRCGRVSTGKQGSSPDCLSPGWSSLTTDSYTTRETFQCLLPQDKPQAIRELGSLAPEDWTLTQLNLLRPCRDHASEGRCPQTCP